MFTTHPFCVIVYTQFNATAKGRQNMSINIVEASVKSHGPSLEAAKAKFMSLLKEDSGRYEDYEVSQAMYDFNIGYNKTAYSVLDKVFGDADRLTWFYEKENDSSRSYVLTGTYHAIVNSLNSLGYDVVDYIAGTCIKQDDNDKRIYKIGRVLSRAKVDPTIINKFSNQKERQTTKKKYCVTVSRNPYDIITMSTFKGWTSCMRFGSGNYQYVSRDVTAGTLVVYMHQEEDKNILNPAGRVLLKQFIVTDKTSTDTKVFYVSENDTYGSFPEEAKEVVDEIVDYINESTVGKVDGTSGIVSGRIIGGLYQDSINTTEVIVNVTDDIDLKNIDTKYWSSKTFRKFVSKIEDHTILLQNSALVQYIKYDKIKDFNNFISILFTKDSNTITTVLRDFYKIDPEKYLNIIKDAGFIDKTPLSFIQTILLYNKDIGVKYFKDTKHFNIVLKSILDVGSEEIIEDDVLNSKEDWLELEHLSMTHRSQLFVEIKKHITSDCVKNYMIYIILRKVHNSIIKDMWGEIKSYNVKMVFYYYLQDEFNDVEKSDMVKYINKKYSIGSAYDCHRFAHKIMDVLVSTCGLFEVFPINFNGKIYMINN